MREQNREIVTDRQTGKDKRMWVSRVRHRQRQKHTHTDTHRQRLKYIKSQRC